MILIDKLAYSSRLRHKNPGLKAAFAAGTLLLCVAARSFMVSLCITAVMGGLIVGLGGTPFRRYIRLMLLPLGFLLISTITIIFHMSEAPSSLLSLKLGSHYLIMDASSLLYGLRLASTSLSAVSCLYFLALTTPLTDLLAVLRYIRCPALIIELMFLMYRFVFVLLELASSILRAQQCRLGNKDFRTSIRSIGQMSAVLLQRALSKSSALYNAMEARGYNGQIRVLDRTCPATKKEKIGIFLFFIFFTGLAMICNLYGGTP